MSGIAQEIFSSAGNQISIGKFLEKLNISKNSTNLFEFDVSNAFNRFEKGQTASRLQTSVKYCMFSMHFLQLTYFFTIFVSLLLQAYFFDIYIFLSTRLEEADLICNSG